MEFIEALRILNQSGYIVERTDNYTKVGRVYKVNFIMMDRRGVMSTAESVLK